MKLTRAGEYAIRGVIGLALHYREDRTVLVSQVAAEQEVSAAFLAKIFQQLVKAGLMVSNRGARGGFALARGPKEITIKDVLEAIEGPTALNHCLLHEDRCKRADGCYMARVWREAQKGLLDVLEKTRISDVVENLRAEKEAGEQTPPQ
jgi:Rrf2 family protein